MKRDTSSPAWIMAATCLIKMTEPAMRHAVFCIMGFVVAPLLFGVAPAFAGDECPAGAQCYYIDPSQGSNGNGTENSPWNTPEQLENAATISTIETAAQSQDVWIFVKAGTTYQMTGNNTFYISINGTSSHWITLDGKSWGTGDRAKIYLYNMDDYRGVWVADGTTYNAFYDRTSDFYLIMQGFEIYSNNTAGKTLLASFNANYVTFQDIYVHGTRLTGGHAYGIYHSTPDDGTHVAIHDDKILNCQADDIGTSCFCVYPYDEDEAYDCEIAYNVGHDFGKYFVSGAGIFFSGVSSSTVHDNVIYDGSGSVDGYGITFEGRYIATTDCLVYNNLIYGGSGIELYYGLSFRGSLNCYAWNNIIYNMSGPGYRTFDDSHGRHTYGTWLCNNTFYNNAGYDIWTAPDNEIEQLKNNVFWKNTSTVMLHDSGAIVYDTNNVYYNTDTSRTAYDGSGGTYTYAQLPYVSYLCQITAPGFINTGNLPTAGGDAAGLGITNTGSAYQNGADLSGMFTDDFEGTTRVTPWDIGAVAY